MAKKLPYKEGTWFGVPLEEGGYAVGRVARHSPKGMIILAYFFGPKRDRLPSVEEVEELSPSNAAEVCRVGDLGLINGDWPIIGDSPNWARDKWPIPSFTRRDDFTKTAWRVSYSDDDPNVVLSDDRIPFHPDVPTTDGLFGAQAAEIVLSRVLNG